MSAADTADPTFEARHNVRETHPRAADRLQPDSRRGTVGGEGFKLRHHRVVGRQGAPVVALPLVVRPLACTATTAWAAYSNIESLLLKV